jgi:hypothetical protein
VTVDSFCRGVCDHEDLVQPIAAFRVRLYVFEYEFAVAGDYGQGIVEVMGQGAQSVSHRAVHDTV